LREQRFQYPVRIFEKISENLYRIRINIVYRKLPVLMQSHGSQSLHQNFATGHQAAYFRSPQLTSLMSILIILFCIRPILPNGHISVDVLDRKCYLQLLNSPACCVSSRSNPSNTS